MTGWAARGHSIRVVRTTIEVSVLAIGWALGGSFFGRIADRVGRSKALMLPILTYAMFTGLSYFATEWWHLMIFRFLAALGIGGEWAVGASLISETWPRRWRPVPQPRARRPRSPPARRGCMPVVGLPVRGSA